MSPLDENGLGAKGSRRKPRRLSSRARSLVLALQVTSQTIPWPLEAIWASWVWRDESEVVAGPYSAVSAQPCSLRGDGEEGAAVRVHSESSRASSSVKSKLVETRDAAVRRRRENQGEAMRHFPSLVM